MAGAVVLVCLSTIDALINCLCCFGGFLYIVFIV